MSEFIPVGANDFQTVVLKAEKPVLLELGAPWCVPCKQLEPVLHKLADSAQDKFVLAKVDVDVSPDLAARLGVMGVPTVILFVGGVEKGRFSGYQPAEKILSRFGAFLGV